MTDAAAQTGGVGTRAVAGGISVLPEAARRGSGTVSFRALGKTYRSAAGEVTALRDIDLDIRPGEVFGIIGRSGAGKSSLLRTINRLESPSSGQVLVDGEDIARLDQAGLVALRRRIGMIFQHFNLLAAKTVRENVALPLRVAGVPRDEIDQRVTQTLSLVGLEGKGDTYPSRLSGGQKQRVGIARALVSRPEILLCDEATSALDPETTISILRLLRDINRRLGLTIVLITHEMSVIREICDRVVVIEKGQIVEEGQVWEVFGKPQHPATRALLQPLESGLPEDLAQRLRKTAQRPSDRLLIALRYGAGRVPDLGRITAATGGQAQVIASQIERIQGHAVGQLLLAIEGRPDSAAVEQMVSDQVDSVEVLGYVDAAND